MNEVWPYLVLLLAGFLPNEVWRIAGLVLARGINEDSELFVWVRSVATAILAGVIAKIVLFPPGGLDAIPLSARLGALGFGFLAFLLARGSVFAGLAAGEAALVFAGLLFPG